ncbi:MAG: fibronectin type III domain-containing protein [Kofleriaceae bacterium]
MSACISEIDGEESTIESEVAGPPANVLVTPTTVDRVNVSWDPVAAALKYYVYRSTNGGPLEFQGTARAPATSLIVANLTTQTDYCFAVATDDGTGAGPLSASTCATTPTAPPPPDSIVASQTSATSVTVDWSAVSNATKYYVYQSGSANGTYSYINSALAPSTSLVVGGLTEMATYCFKVQADSPNGRSTLSAPACNNTIAPPSNVTATRTTSTRIKLTWTGVTGATKYYIHEIKAGTPRRYRGSVLATAPATYTATGLTTGVQYCYQLRSQGTPTSNVSGYSLPIVCATP